MASTTSSTTAAAAAAAAPPRHILAMGALLGNQGDPTGKVLTDERAKAEAQNFQITMTVFDVVNDPLEKTLAALQEKLQEKKYDVISIGFGIRGNRDFTLAFEKMVNLCWAVQPSVKMAFANYPWDIVDACVRVLEEN